MALLRTYCATHEMPWVPEHLVDFLIGVWDLHPIRGVHVSAIDEFWGQMRTFSHASAGNYVIPALVGDGRASELTGIVGYKKFIVRGPLENPAPAQYSNIALSAPDAQRLPRDAIEPAPGYEFLVASPLELEVGVVAQYINAHCGIDLFDYLSLAVELGVLSGGEANEFARETRLIPGGCEVGVYPTAWICSTLKQLERTGREFLIRYALRLRGYEGFQARAVDFLSERLGSYLLLKELDYRYPKGVPRAVWGQSCEIA